MKSVKYLPIEHRKSSGSRMIIDDKRHYRKVLSLRSQAKSQANSQVHSQPGTLNQQTGGAENTLAGKISGHIGVAESEVVSFRPRTKTNMAIDSDLEDEFDFTFEDELSRPGALF